MEIYLTTESLPEFERHYSNPTCTVAEYWAAGAQRENNIAGKFIDKGLEPFLINGELLRFSMEPLVAIYDCGIEKPDGAVSLDLHSGEVVVPDSTVVAWR